ncbi:hypothetical protein V1511DRAFT_303022 [Dipodascopsis uninucleata]
MASAPAPQQPPAQMRSATVRPALRPILPKPPAVAPMPTPGGPGSNLLMTGGDRASLSGLKAGATSINGTAVIDSVTGTNTSLSQLGSRMIGSVASSIFSGSTTITLPPRPSASRSKSKKRTSPDRLLAGGTETTEDKKIDSAVSQNAALKKRRRAKGGLAEV